MYRLLFPLLLSCKDPSTYVPPGDDTGEADADADTDSDTDTDVGTDEDGDGWTVEDGDCDDSSIYVNPAWDEQPGDGLDNDCDGRIDEEWGGLAVARQYVYDNSHIVLFDSVGRIDAELELDAGMAPVFLAEGIGGGWAYIHDPDPNTDPDFEVPLHETAALVVTDDEGNGTLLAEFELDEDEEAYEAGLAGLDDQPAVRGLVAHPDGYYVTARRGSLLQVDTDGRVSELASFNYDFSNDPDGYEIYPMDLSVNLVTGEVAVFGFLGGFGVWSEDSGFQLLRSADLSDNWENWDAMLVKGGACDDGWFGLMVNYQTYEFGVHRFNLDKGEWVEKLAWGQDLIYPELMTINEDEGDWYVTANAGWYATVWRLRQVDSSVDDFYSSGATEPGYFFRGVVSRY